MRRFVAPLLAAVVVAGLGTSVPADAAPTRTTVSAVLTPSAVTTYTSGQVEPTALLAVVSPAVAGRTVVFQQAAAGGWATLDTETTNSAGRAAVTLLKRDGDTGGQYRVVVTATARARAATSSTVNLKVTPNTQCGPSIALVDGAATGETVCLALRLDRWRASRVMGIGQQLLVTNRDWQQPVADLAPLRPAVIGFDLEELRQTATFSTGTYEEQVIEYLMEQAHDGAVLTASWHMRNPWTGGPFTDRDRVDLGALVERNAANPDAYDRFWADVDEVLALLKRFQTGDADGVDGADDSPCRCAPVIVRPFHEANGAFFWWGKRDPATYKKLWTALVDHAAAQNVHNLLWAWSANRWTRPSVASPSTYRPAKVDIGGLDTYDPEAGRGNSVDRLNLEGYPEVASTIGRVALTEVGPHTSSGNWNPAVINRTVTTLAKPPLYAMLWFDDGPATKSYPGGGRKQIGSLDGGRAWLRSCFGPALCYLPR